ncbi:hypothetical protein N7537_003113 [Penicillium hordei]|uniref:Uncharacterized protein n=1 Tax=Penicillium hordei TaxID=40994 RepID=A0AAD6H9E8_9EURO|nr:uncharacterized protein N7537_003113 [Penicillium hordei]KAJ5617999.1 hypothetical protein N7537_003113 [Penicillium hordei]
MALRQIGVDLHRTSVLALYDVRRRASGVLLVCNILMIDGRAIKIIMWGLLYCWGSSWEIYVGATTV